MDDWKALTISKQAVEADCNHDYVNALLNYKETILILEAEMSNAPEEFQQQMIDLVRIIVVIIYGRKNTIRRYYLLRK